MQQPAMENEAEQMAGPDPELAATMGFSGFGKKARTFDFTAMFEQTRRTAVERSRKILEEREKEAAEKEKESAGQQGGADSSGGAGSQLVKKVSSREMSSSESEDSLDEEFVGPPLPPKESVDDSDEELIGPPLPPGYKNEEDDDDDDGDDDDDESAQEEDESPPARSSPFRNCHNFSSHNGCPPVAGKRSFSWIDEGLCDVPGIDRMHS